MAVRRPASCIRTAVASPDRRTRALAVGALLWAVACGGGGAGAPDADADASEVGTADTATPTPRWARQVVARGMGGRHVALALGPDGQPRVAWFASEGEAAGPCDALGADPPPAVTWPLWYAEGGEEGFSVERAADVLLVGSPVGLDLGVQPDGASVIATLSGEPVVALHYCGASDVGYYLRAGADDWQATTAVATSGEAASGEPASDFGDVVGYWPALAFDASGQPAIAYKDVHSGSIQSDDFRRADLELAWREGGAWQALPVDVGQGAGSFSDLVFDAQDRPVIASFNPRDDRTLPQRGLWLYRSADAGAAWERVRLFGGETTERPSLAVDPTSGALVVAWYDAGDRLPYLARLEAGADFSSASAWAVEEIGDHRFDEGEHPSLAFDPSGRLALAYARCARATDPAGQCNPSVDAVVFAWRDTDGGFQREVVDAGETAGPCGAWPNLAFDAGGAAWVAYHCATLEAGELTDEVRAARREALP